MFAQVGINLAKQHFRAVFSEPAHRIAAAPPRENPRTAVHKMHKNGHNNHVMGFICKARAYDKGKSKTDVILSPSARRLGHKYTKQQVIVQKCSADETRQLGSKSQLATISSKIVKELITHSKKKVQTNPRNIHHSPTAKCRKTLQPPERTIMHEANSNFPSESSAGGNKADRQQSTSGSEN